MSFEKALLSEHRDLSPISLEESLDLYLLMYKVRKAEEKIIFLYPTDQLKTPMHMSLGQEAASVGVIYALGGTGDIFSTYRSHAAFLSQTEDLDVFFAEMYGKETGTAEGRSGSMHLSFPEKNHLLSSAIVSSCIPVAVGAAYANKMQKSGRIATVFFGDGALDEGVFWESINAASLYNLPLLFICEDNDFAVHTHRSNRHGYESIDRVVSTLNCLPFSDETNDVEKIYQMAKKAVKASLEENKPAFLRIRCHRNLEHVGIHEDWHEKYRDKESYHWWHQNDSLALQKQRLLNIGLNEELVKNHESAIDLQIEEAIVKATEANFCSSENLYKGVFCEKD